MSHVTDIDGQVEDYLLHTLAALMTGQVRVHELPAALVALMRWSSDARVEALQHEADRLYAEMARRPAAPTPAPESFADLSDLRGDHARADRHRARMQGVAA